MDRVVESQRSLKATKASSSSRIKDGEPGQGEREGIGAGKDFSMMAGDSGVKGWEGEVTHAYVALGPIV